MDNYRWFDLHDEEEETFHTGTLSEVKAWLIDYWQWNNDDQYNEFELERMFLNIQKATPNELDNKLGGIGWTLEDYTQ